MILAYPILAFVIAYTVVLLLLKTRLSKLALDQPNHRSLHVKVIPRTGGLAVMTGFIVSATFLHAWLWLVPLSALIAISLVDDIVQISVRWRFFIHLAVSTAFVAYIVPEASIVGLAILIFALVWTINLYNFMDGSDGLAAGMAIFGFIAYAYVAWMGGNIELTILCTSIVSAALAFLRFNFHPASIFLGDTGSIPLGFLAGAIGIYGWANGLWTLWYPLLIFSPFIIDASVTLLKRIIRGEKIWQAHRSHYYQRLVQMGWGHQNTALAEYGLMFMVGLSAILALEYRQFLLIIMVGWAGIYFLLIKWIDKRWALFISEHNQCS